MPSFVGPALFLMKYRTRRTYNSDRRDVSKFRILHRLGLIGRLIWEILRATEYFLEALNGVAGKKTKYRPT